MCQVTHMYYENSEEAPIYNITRALVRFLPNRELIGSKICRPNPFSIDFFFFRIIRTKIFRSPLFSVERVFDPHFVFDPACFWSQFFFDLISFLSSLFLETTSFHFTVFPILTIFDSSPCRYNCFFNTVRALSFNTVNRKRL